MNGTQLTNAELVERFPQMTNKATAMKSLMDVLKESLEPVYQGLELRPYFENEDVGLILPKYVPELKGYNLVQRTELDQPRTIQPTGLFRKLRKPVTQTYEERNVVYGSVKNLALDVLVNEKEVLQACEEVTEKTQGNVKVKLRI